MPNKFKIQEIDIIHTELYKMFDELLLPLKKQYLQYFTVNCVNEEIQQKFRQQNNERQNHHLNYVNQSSQNNVPFKRQINQRPYSAAPKSRAMQPAELRFFQQVKEKITLFQQSNEDYQQEYTIRCLGNKKKLDPDVSNTTDRSIKSNRSFKMINKENTQNRTSAIQDDMWPMIEDILQKDINQCDVILNKNNDVVMILSQFQIMYKSNEWQTIKTFPYLTSQNIKYNQQIRNEEVEILTSSKMLNSNIINAYINYLMIEDEKRYFSYNKEYREKNKRLFIFTSEFITDCAIDIKQDLPKEQLQEKYLYLWLKYLENFKNIQYKFWLIYKQIGFVVNNRNCHWYFVQVYFEQKTIVIFDSIKKSECFYYYIKDLLQYLFKEITKDENLTLKISFAKDFPQQTDVSSCGYYTCIAANAIMYGQSRKYLKLADIQTILKKELLTFE